VYLYGGSVFIKGGLRELRDRLPGMMTLISLAITVAFVFSLAVTLGYPDEALWSWPHPPSCSWATGSRCGRSCRRPVRYANSRGCYPAPRNVPFPCAG
jgi:hypothetical protein